MSEQDEHQPLTRRERRLREMAETGALDLSEVRQDAGSTAAPAPEAAPAQAPAPESDELEISPFNEDGTPRSRREMRMLREEALARRAAAEPSGPAAAAPAKTEGPVEATESAAQPESESPVEPEAAEEPVQPEAPAELETPAETDAPAEPEALPQAEPPAATEVLVQPVVEEPVSPADAAAEEEISVVDIAAAGAGSGIGSGNTDLPAGAVSGELDFDSLIAPPTEPFTVADLQEAESLDSAEAEPAEAAPEAVGAEAPAEPETRQAHDPLLRAETPEVAAEVVEPEAAPEETEPDAVEAEPVVEIGPEVEIDPVPFVGAESETGAADPLQAVSPEEKSSYSFPDIAPPEEWRSVFDDPAARNVPSQGQGGDFDDLISRAVAQESVATTNGTSALILPTMPEDTGGLTGPIGATGDLYVTGSLKLPKSLGETGGHASLHDSVEIDPLTSNGSEPTQLIAEGPAPVSARNAVSARGISGLSVVAKPAKEKNKLPLVLSITGGGLLIVVIGLGVWGFNAGIFG